MESNHRAAGAYRKNQGLIKSTESEKAPRERRPDPAPPPSPPASGATATPAGIRRVAQFLTLIGRREAASVLKTLPRDEADRIVDTMAHLDPISASEARQVLSAFGAQQGSVSHAVSGGPETAREILIRAFGDKEGERRFYEVLPDERPRRFSFLDEMDGHQLALLLREEQAPTVALIVANVSQETAARLMEALPATLKVGVVRRLANVAQVDGAVLDSIETALRRRMESIERPDQETVDGESRLAAMLRYLDLQTSDAILSQLDRQNPESAESIRARLTTPEDLLLLDRRDTQEVLNRMDDIDLAVVLKGVGEPVREHLRTHVSERRAEAIAMHRETLGPMRRQEVNRVVGEFVELIRGLERDKVITLHRDGEEFVD